MCWMAVSKKRIVFEKEEAKQRAATDSTACSRFDRRKPPITRMNNNPQLTFNARLISVVAQASP